MKYKHRKLILKLYLYRYLKLNPVKFNIYYQLVTLISKLLFEIGKPITFLKKRYYDYKYYSIIPLTDKEKENIDDNEQKQILNMKTIVFIDINTKKVKFSYSDYISLICSFLRSQNLVRCDKKQILNHPTLPDRIKKLMVDIPYFRNIDFIRFSSDLINAEDKVPTVFHINDYFDFNNPKDRKLVLDWVYFQHSSSRNSYLFFPYFYFYSILLDESNQSSFYIDIYKNQIHLEIIRFIKFFYTYFKFVLILVVANFLFGFIAAKLLISIFLFYGFFSILKAKRYILFLKRVWILFLFSIGYSFLNLSISIPLLNLIVSFLILKTIYFLVINIGSISYKLNYPKYTFINWLYLSYWGRLKIFLGNKEFNSKFYKKDEKKTLFYKKMLLWLESIEEREITLLKTQK